MRSLIEGFGAQGDFGGAHLTPEQQSFIIEHLKDKAPGLANAIKEAGKSGGDVVVADRDQNLDDVKKTFRHERWHTSEHEMSATGSIHDHLGSHTDAFLKHPLAIAPAMKLRRMSYEKHEIAAELGAFLASGQYREIGLDRKQWKVLFYHYVTLLKAEHGAKLEEAVRHIAPALQEIIRAITTTGNYTRAADAAVGSERQPGLRPAAGRDVSGAAAGSGSGPAQEVTPAGKDAAQLTASKPEGNSGINKKPAFARVGVPSSARGTTVYAIRPVTLGTPLLDKLVDGWDSAHNSLLKTFHPYGLSAEADTSGLSLREHAARAAQTFARAEEALKSARKLFSKRTWDENLAFINRMEDGAPQPNAAEQAIADTMRELLDSHRTAVQNLGKNKLTTFYENYFPHLWNKRKGQDPESIFRAIFGKRPIEGTKSFLKQRKFHSFQEAVDAGLTPVSENPVDLVMLKLKEMERYTLAHTFLNEMKSMGLAKYVPSIGAKKQPPSGWVKIPDQIGTVWGPPFLAIQEAHDKQFVGTLLDLANDLGLDMTRVAKLRSAWGRAYKGTNRLKTKFAGPESVILHEMGHLLDWKYGLGDQLVKNPDFKQELRDLAELRLVGNDTPYFQQYIKRGEEKMANMIAAYGHAPAQFQKVAPKTFRWFDAFVKSHPELAPLSKIHYGLQIQTHATEYPTGGFIQRGNYYMPPGAAQLVSNYLSPGLNGEPWYQILRSSSNLMLQFALGFSGFHAGFVTFDSMTSKLSVAIQYAADGKPITALKHGNPLAVAYAPIANVRKGSRIRNAYLKAAVNDPELAKYVDAIVQGGGRVEMDAQYRSGMRRQFLDAWRRNSPGALALTALPALAETVMWPTLEFLVPRMKLGMFADMVDFELKRLGPDATQEQVRRAFSGAWDSVDNRMGQLVYDNLFWNRTAKDLMMLTVQSVGWNLGTFREFGGAASDIAGFGKDAIRGIGGRMSGARGQGGKGGGPGSPGSGSGPGGGGSSSGPRPPASGPNPRSTRRMAYTLATVLMTALVGSIMNYVNTKGRTKRDGTIDNGLPHELRDYFFPRTGGVDEQGHDERMALWGYLKDLVGWYMEPTALARNKLSPILRMAAETISNRNFYNQKIWDGENNTIPEDILSELKHLGSFFEPMVVSGMLRERDRGAGIGMQVGQFIGLRTAPAYITRSPAERYMAEYQAAHSRGEAPTTAQRLAREIVKAQRAGNSALAGRISDDAVLGGKMTAEQSLAAFERSFEDPLVLEFKKSMPIEVSIEAYRLMDLDERHRTAEVFDHKIDLIDDGKHPEEEVRRMQDKLERAGLLQ